MAQENNHGENENITLHIKYQEPINKNNFIVWTDTITFGSQEELNKYVNGEAAYDVLDNSVMRKDNEILLYAEYENGDVVCIDENEPLVAIDNMEYDEDGYLHFTVEADGYELEGLYRIYDPKNGDSMELVSIDYGYLHPIIQRQWERIENALHDIVVNHYQKKENRLFVDMDGTLAKYQPVDTMEILFEKGYFLNLEPQQNVVDAIKKIIKEQPEMEVYIMSSVLTDSKYALQEKNEWLDKYLPEIDKEHRIFPPCGENKLDYVPNGIRPTDFLLDDYTKNLTLWEPPAKGIKLLNGINHTNETWKGSMLRYDKESERLAEDIVMVMQGMRIQDKRPWHQMIHMANQVFAQESVNGYISEETKAQLEWLTEQEAKAAIREGIHICCINDFPEYHGIHAEDYFMTELKSEKGVQNLYHTFGHGVVHKACISPRYAGLRLAQPIDLKDALKVLLLEKNVPEVHEGTELKKDANVRRKEPKI